MPHTLEAGALISVEVSRKVIDIPIGRLSVANTLTESHNFALMRLVGSHVADHADGPAATAVDLENRQDGELNPAEHATA